MVSMLECMRSSPCASVQVCSKPPGSNAGCVVAATEYVPQLLCVQVVSQEVMVVERTRVPEAKDSGGFAALPCLGLSRAPKLCCAT
eukprot:380527-Rhodomonas_salina.2